MSQAKAQPSRLSPDPGPFRRRVEALCVSLLGGVFLWAGLRWPEAGPLVGVAYAVLMAPAVVHRWRAPLFGFLPGFLAWVWLAHLPLKQFHWIAVVALPPLLTWSYFLAAVLASWLRRITRWPAWIILPIALGAGEWIRPFVNPGEFNLYGVGAALFDWTVLIQAADLVGAQGLTVLWMIPCGLLVEGARVLLDRNAPQSMAVPGHRSLLLGSAASLVVVVGLVTYGMVRGATVESHPGPRVAIVQPSLDHAYDLTRQVVLQQQRMTANWVPPGSSDLVVWPENAILAPYERTPEYQEVVAWLARSRQAPLLLGAQGFSPDGTRPSNTAFLVNEQGEIAADYHKVVLFPFTERYVFPGLANVWPWLHERLIGLTLLAWRDAPNGWGPDEPEVITAELGGEPYRIWTPICYETAYTRLGRKARQQGADFFVNLTSTGWMGWAPANSMLGASVMRAVEARVGVVRAANTGVSGFISPIGTIDEVLMGKQHGRPQLDAGVVISRVQLSKASQPVYSRWGSWIDPLSFILCLGVLVFGLVRRLRSS